MSRSRLKPAMGAAGVVAAGLAALAVALPGTGSAQAPGSTTLTFYEPDAGGTFRIVDNAPKSPVKNPESRRYRFSPGDEVILAQPLFDRAGGTRQGTLYLSGKVVAGKTFGNAKILANGAYVLNDGSQLTAHGLFTFTSTVTVAITGGTGAHVGARGQLVSSNVTGGTQDVITLLP
jgi:hypothetical protein